MYLKTNRRYAFLTALSAGVCAVATANGWEVRAGFTAFGTVMGFFAATEAPKAE